MTFPTTPGIRHVPPASMPAVQQEAIGIVVQHPEDALDYISAIPGGLPTGYYVIRFVEDVPDRLGGIASLTDEWPDGLAEALSRACGISEAAAGPDVPDAGDAAAPG